MRIREAIKYHYKKHTLTYGIISFVLCFIGAVFIPEFVRFVFKLVHKSYGWTLGIGLLYGLVLVGVAMPAVIAIKWLRGND